MIWWLWEFWLIKTKNTTGPLSYRSQSAKYDWQGQLYLAMSYFLDGQPVDAQDLFLRLSNECPEAEIRGKAQSAFVAVRDKLTEDREKRKATAGRTRPGFGPRMARRTLRVFNNRSCEQPLAGLNR